MVLGTTFVLAFVPASAVVGILFALSQWYIVSKISVGRKPVSNNGYMHVDEDGIDNSSVDEKVAEIQSAISEGSEAFLTTMYTYLAIFMGLFSVIIFVFLASVGGFSFDRQPCDYDQTKSCPSSIASAFFSTVAFILGALTSTLSGYLGMKIATYANARTTLEARKGVGKAFAIAFRSGAVMGFLLAANGLLVLFLTILVFKLYFGDDWVGLYEAITGYGLGGSSVALFGRVGGGIYTKAADVGADLVGKVEQNIPEDDPRNPAVIADNVGDNVGDIAGMGADLFGSFAESTCAALVVSSISSFGNDKNFVAMQLVISTVLMTVAIFLISWFGLPETFTINVVGHEAKVVKNWHIFFCVGSGLWAGLIIGFVTEYFTSNAYTPVQDVADSCRTGAATNIIFGLALGYKSVIVPVFAIAVAIYLSFSLAAMYGIAVAALGMLSTLATGLAIDAYGPISDNAGGIAEMAGMSHEVRERTDALDAAGNTTAAIGKGFAIGSAALVSLALFGAYVSRAGIASVDVIQPKEFVGLIVGAMLPYWFSAMTMKSVGKAALAMVEEGGVRVAVVVKWFGMILKCKGTITHHFFVVAMTLFGNS
uniref:H(+)-exporting diphosphatase n=1 Tax=Physcomitrium patens TaxID=3218 RepID=A0A7I4BQ03_PHYPA